MRGAWADGSVSAAVVRFHRLVEVGEHIRQRRCDAVPVRVEGCTERIIEELNAGYTDGIGKGFYDIFFRVPFELETVDGGVRARPRASSQVRCA